MGTDAGHHRVERLHSRYNYNREGKQEERIGNETGWGNMLDLIQLSAACRGSQYRDIVPVCGGSAERVVDTSCTRKERVEGGCDGKEERATNLAAPSFPEQVTSARPSFVGGGLFDFEILM